MAPDKSTGAKPADPRTAGRQSGAAKTTPARPSGHKTAEKDETPRTTPASPTPPPSPRADDATTGDRTVVQRAVVMPAPSEGPESSESTPVPPVTPAPPASRGRVSLITLQQGVLHRQRATDVDRLQEALGLAPTGQPDDALDAAVAEFREAAGLGVGSVDAALLERLGFDVATW